MFCFGGGDRRAVQIGVPLGIAAQQLHRCAQGNIGAAVLYVYIAGNGGSVVGQSIRAGMDGQNAVLAGGDRRAAVPDQVPAAHGVQQTPQGEVSSALFQPGGFREQLSVHLDADAALCTGRYGQGQRGQKAAENCSFHEKSSFLLGNLVFIIPKSALLEQPSKTAGRENFSLGKDCVDNIERRYYNEVEEYRLSILKENRMSKEPLKVLTESMFYVLLSLLRQDRCGTEIVQYVDDTTAGRVSLGPGTLYTILAKFEEEGLIRETAVEGRKRTYAITDRGRALYRQELSRLRLCVADGEREEC